MSYWTYINGTIKVSPLGRTQAEKRYILDTILDHLPQVTGSEGGMKVHIVQCDGFSGSSSHDEFGCRTNNLVNKWGHKSRKNGWRECQDNYILVLEASLRDREFDFTFREFMNWICRLSKRVMVQDILVRIDGYGKSYVINEEGRYDNKYYKMFESPTWSMDNNTGEPTWCEYLMWDRAKGSNLPILLEYKYYANEENDKEAERRIHYDE